jgi:hypothetical protein
MNSLYQDLKSSGIETDSHESDLYAVASEKSLQIIQEHGFVCSCFQSEGKNWYEIPFAYDPFWEKHGSTLDK